MLLALFPGVEICVAVFQNFHVRPLIKLSLTLDELIGKSGDKLWWLNLILFDKFTQIDLNALSSFIA